MFLLKTGDNSYVFLTFADPSQRWDDNGYGEYEDRSDSVINVIHISSELRGCTLLDTIIHECTHCLLDYMAEEHVKTFATRLARILHELGYRTDETELIRRSDAAGRCRTGDQRRITEGLGSAGIVAQYGSVMDDERTDRNRKKSAKKKAARSGKAGDRTADRTGKRNKRNGSRKPPAEPKS